MKTVKLGNVEVGPGHPPYIIAEIGANHNGDMKLARATIEAAAKAGAHSAKFQSWSEQSLIANEEYERNTSYSDTKRHFGSLRAMVRAYQLTPAQHREAQQYCRDSGITFSSSAFSHSEVDLLDSLDVPFIKIASMDINYWSLLEYAASTKRPLILSTGMASLGEIEEAVNIVRAQGNNQIVVLHCISIYPPADDAINLRNMQTLQQAFETPVGFSDHTLGTAIPLAAIANGACLIEKHFTLDQDMEGWDHTISANPEQLRQIVDEGLLVWKALGSTRRVIGAAEMEKRRKFRRSLVATRPLPAGHVVAVTDLTAKRPGTGVPPDAARYVVGRKLAKPLIEDQVLNWDDLA